MSFEGFCVFLELLYESGWCLLKDEGPLPTAWKFKNGLGQEVMVNIKATNRLFPQVPGYRSDGSVVMCKELWLTHTSASDTSAGPQVGEIRYFSVLFNHIPLG